MESGSEVKRANGAHGETMDEKSEALLLLSCFKVHWAASHEITAHGDRRRDWLALVLASSRSRCSMAQCQLHSVYVRRAAGLQLACTLARDPRDARRVHRSYVCVGYGGPRSARCSVFVSGKAVGFLRG